MLKSINQKFLQPWNGESPFVTKPPCFEVELPRTLVGDIVRCPTARHATAARAVIQQIRGEKLEIKYEKGGELRKKAQKMRTKKGKEKEL